MGALLVSIDAPRADALELYTHTLPPFTNTENGTISGGMVVDLVQAMMNHLGEDHDIKALSFSRLLETVQSGGQSAGFIVMRTPERENTVQWVGPLVTNQVVLYKRADSDLKISSLDDARKVQRIGVARGNADHTYLTEQGFTNLDVSYGHDSDLRKLAIGRVDLAPMGNMVMPEMARKDGFSPADFRSTGVVLYESVLYMAFSKDVPAETVTRWQAALDHLKTTRAYDLIVRKHTVMN